MKQTTVRMDDNLYWKVREYTLKKRIKIFDFIISAIREKLDKEGGEK